MRSLPRRAITVAAAATCAGLVALPARADDRSAVSVEAPRPLELGGGAEMMWPYAIGGYLRAGYRPSRFVSFGALGAYTPMPYRDSWEGGGALLCGGDSGTTFGRATVDARVHAVTTALLDFWIAPELGALYRRTQSSEVCGGGPSARVLRTDESSWAFVAGAGTGLSLRLTRAVSLDVAARTLFPLPQDYGCDMVFVGGAGVSVYL